MIKNSQGNKSAGVRARKGLRQVKKSATDLFTSNIEVNDLVRKIKMISLKKYLGTVNVGLKRHSDYVAYKRYKNDLKPCKRKDIIKYLSVKLAKASSMNLNLLHKNEKNL